jgi:serine/threonine protein kinase
VLLPGTTLAGRYLIRRSLGTGAMGEVHEAEDRLLGKTVALKTLNARLASDPQAMMRLRREVAMAHRVTHANVCRIFDLGADEGGLAWHEGAPLLFLTMEFLPGETLAAHLRRRGPLAPTEALPLLWQLADGLAAAHAGGVIHRDLKGENVMLVARPPAPDRVVITDFGLAGSIAQFDPASHDSTGFVGTPAYAAPERLMGAPATPASDVYSFGLIAVEMLIGPLGGTRGAPPSASGAVSTLGDSARPWRIPNSISSGWHDLVAAMTHPSPIHRLRDGGAVREAIEALMRQASKGQRAPRPGRPTWPVVGALSALVGMVVAGVAILDRQPPGSRDASEVGVVAAGRLVPVTPTPAVPVSGPAVSSAPAPEKPQPRRDSQSSSSLAASRERLAKTRLLRPRSDAPIGLAGNSGPARVAAPPAPPVPAADEIVRELHGPRGGVAAGAAGDGELVDPFTDLRGRRVGTEP